MLRLILLLAMTTSTLFGLARAQSPWPLAPPARYDHPYKGHLNTIVVPYGTARQNCYKLGGAVLPDNTAACAIVGNGRCTIVLPRSPVADLVKALRRHEIAHCNGWPSNHPA